MRPFAACCALILVITGAAAAQGFDPYKKQVVDYGVPQDFAGNPHHDQLTCFYYRGLMVKQLTNQWNKGALFLSFLRFDQARPACVKEHSPTEKVLDPEWGGYFRGLVKGDLVFFDADDGEDGGMPFVVYDSKTQKKIFEDNAYYFWMWNPKLRPVRSNSATLLFSPGFSPLSSGRTARPGLASTLGGLALAGREKERAPGLGGT